MGSGYTVMIDGVAVACETPEHVIALVRAHGGGSGATPARKSTQDSGGNSRWTDQRVAEFNKLIEGKQRKLLDALLSADDGKTDDQLLGIVGVSNGMGLAGVFAGLYKNAKKVGADPKELYVKKPLTIGDKRGYEYALHDAFRRAATKRK